MCQCLKAMLKECGFDCSLALKCINKECIEDIENDIRDKSDFLKNLPKCHGKLYGGQSCFKFLPAHRLLLLKLPEIVENLYNETHLFTVNNESFSNILKELINSALNNSSKAPQGHRFSDILLNFSMYVYMISGRASYEFLSANLPLPKVSTIREFSIYFSPFQFNRTPLGTPF